VRGARRAIVAGSYARWSGGRIAKLGRELPVDDQPFNIPLIFHPKTIITRVVVSSTGCNLTRTSSDGGAVSRMWVFKFIDAMIDHLPAHALPDRSRPRPRRTWLERTVLTLGVVPTLSNWLLKAPGR